MAKKAKPSVDERIRTYIKNAPWQHLALAGFIVLLFLFQLSVFSQYEHLPGPVYGGDLYRENGFVQHFVNGNPFWTDPYLKGEYKFYPPLGYVGASWVALLFGASVTKILIYLPLFTAMLVTIGAFMLGRAVFEDDTYALMMAMAASLFEIFIHVKHVYALGYGFTLIFLSYFVRLQRNPTRKTKIVGGVFLGLTALSHYKPFLYSVFIVLFYVIFDFILELMQRKPAKQVIVTFFKRYWITAVIGIALSLIFFGPLIAHYKMENLNLTNQYSLFDPDKFGAEWVWKQMRYTFSTRGDGGRTGFYWLVTFGALYCILNFKKKLGSRFALFSLVGLWLGTAHYLITRPLFDNWIVPGHISGGLIIPKLILFVYGVRLITSSLNKYAPKLKNAKLIMLFVILALVLFPAYAKHYRVYESDQWVKYGRQLDLSTQLLFDIGDWMVTQTNEDDVFLAHDESSFMLNAVSGRKVVTVRRTHASPYVDMDQRYADTIVMLYGDNPDVQKQLIEKYGVTYLYLDRYVTQGHMATHPRFEQLLKDNGVEYQLQMIRLDPSTPDAPAYNYLVVQPQNITAVELFDPVQPFQVGSDPHSLFYKLKN